MAGSRSSEDGTVKPFEMETAPRFKTWTAHAAACSCCALPRGRPHIVTGGRDRLVKVWDGNGTVH